MMGGGMMGGGMMGGGMMDGGVTGGGVTGGGVMGRVCTAYGIGQAGRRRNDAAPCEHAHVFVSTKNTEGAESERSGTEVRNILIEQN